MFLEQVRDRGLSRLALIAANDEDPYPPGWPGTNLDKLVLVAVGHELAWRLESTWQGPFTASQRSNYHFVAVPPPTGRQPGDSEAEARLRAVLEPLTDHPYQADPGVLRWSAWSELGLRHKDRIMYRRSRELSLLGTPCVGGGSTQSGVGVRWITDPEGGHALVAGRPTLHASNAIFARVCRRWAHMIMRRSSAELTPLIP